MYWFLSWRVLFSPVVLVLDETAVVSELVSIAVSEAVTETVVVAAVFAKKTVDVAVVVSGPAVWVHHVWKRSSGSSPPNSHQHFSHLSLCG